MGALIESPANVCVYTRCPIRICRTTWVDCCPMRFKTGVTRTTTLLGLDMRRAHVFSQQHLISANILLMPPPGAAILSKSWLGHFLVIIGSLYPD